MVGKTIEWIRQEYKRISEDGSGTMSVSQGKTHKYLGMTLDCTVIGISIISILEYFDEIMTAFEKMDPRKSGTKSSAAPENPFKVDEDCEKLSQEKAKGFHNLVTKILLNTKRSRPDTCTSFTLITTRVREPDINDWQKLAHLMKYLRKTRKLPLILGDGGAGILKWWIYE